MLGHNGSIYGCFKVRTNVSFFSEKLMSKKKKQILVVTGTNLIKLFSPYLMLS
jgi:hypothetical protein